jgi:spore maturation protein CgeB
VSHKLESTKVMGLVIVGNQGGTNIGSSLARAATELGIEAHHCDARLAFQAPRWLARINWKLRDHRPTNLSEFSRYVVETCRQQQPTCLIGTGLAPLEKSALTIISEMGIRCINYLTDDPWNANFSSHWFFAALPCYDDVFTPRQANISELRTIGCPHVEYLPFGFDPLLFYREASLMPTNEQYDVIFAGGCDKDRVPYIAALANAGFKIALYGDYWERSPYTKPYYKGHADPETLRQATSNAKVALCLVRRANRDGHVMRSFEVPAVKTCMLAEATAEHQAIFGDDLAAVAYFQSIPEMVEKLHFLIRDEERRAQLAAAAHCIVMKKSHTYKDRLKTMLRIEELCD